VELGPFCILASLTFPGALQIHPPPEFARQSASKSGYILLNEVPLRQLKPKYSLAWAVRSGGLAQANYQLLVLSSSKPIREVHAIGDLAGAVSISSREDALSVVRLRTCMFTFNSFACAGETWSEIADRSSLSADFCLGQVPRKGMASMFWNGYYAVLSHKSYIECKVRDPIVRKAPGRYLVSRAVVRWIGNSAAPSWVEEEVSVDCAYQVVSMTSLPNPSVQRIPWELPRTRK